MASSAACGAQPDCLEESRPVEEDDETLGFSARTVVDGMAGEHRSAMAYTVSDLPDSEVTLVLGTTIHDIRLIESRENPRNTNENAKHCEDRLRIATDAEFRSADGSFDEALAVDFEAELENHVSIRTEMKHDMLQGDYVPPSEDVSGELESLWFDAVLAPGQFSGGVFLVVRAGNAVAEGADVIWPPPDPET